ncbi:type 1 fimbrial protein subunit FimI [Citrobacter sp.]|uniref:type 1 fimbrial protein subunit FimI n=1 Tax=Citrobacter sp. TaxID=1896336 RepID=UPI003FA54DD7
MWQITYKGMTLAGMLCVMPALAQTVILESGRLHLRGQFVNGACTVASDSQSLRVQMGQYRTNAFGEPGSFASTSVPFSLRLTSCSADVYDHVGIAFAGVTPAEDPQVFLASGDASAASGIGLALFDEGQRQIIPNALPLHYAPILTQEMTFHFTARYRAVSENITPGTLRSDVWFTLVYP